MIAVAVDDHAGEPVALAPDQPSKLRIESAPGPVVDGLLEAALEEFEVEVLALAREAPGDDLGLGIVDGGADEAVLAILERDDVAVVAGCAKGLEHFTGVRPNRGRAGCGSGV